jgi:hypothetical protein
MTDKNWNLEEWFVDYPAPPPYSGPIVDMPIPGKIQKVTEFLLGEVTKEALRCLNVQAELASLLLCLAAVDYMAGFFVGKQTGRNDFIAFMDEYFPPKYTSFSGIIYDQLRCGLMHNLVAVNPWKKKSSFAFRIHPNSEIHLEKISDEETLFSVRIFLEDVKRAWVMYAHDVVMKGDRFPEIVNKFNRRFNNIGGRGALMMRIPD